MKATRRLFFALWPTDVLREQILQQTEVMVGQASGRAIPASNLHVTLLFLGAVAEEDLPRIMAAGAGTSGTRFELCFDVIESWGRSKVLVLGASHVPQPLSDLVDSLRISLLGQQIATEAEDYRPHVTLARNVAARQRSSLHPVMRWQVGDFVLVESTPGPRGSRYEVLARWPLA